jgi:hypothetical protein
MYNELSFLHGGTTTKNKSRETKRKKEWGSFDFPSRCSLLFWLVLLTIGAEAAGTHGSLSAGISWARRQKEVVQLLRERKGGERSKRGPDEASKTQEKMGGKDGDRGRGGTVWCPPASHLSPWKRGLLSLFSPPSLQKQRETIWAFFSLKVFTT